MFQRNTLLPFVIFYTSLIWNDVAVSSLEEKDFVHGNKGSNSCVKSYSPITSSLWACRAAMSMADSSLQGDQDGDNFQGSEDDPGFPKGCYFCPQSTNTCEEGYWFNEHSEGSGEKSARLLCAKDNPDVVDDSTEVAFIGDSDIDYWSTTESIIPGSYNYGVGGSTCKNVMKEIDSLLNTVQDLKVIVLVCGENDLSDGGKVGKTFKRFKMIVKKANNKNVQVIYLGTKPEPSTKSIHGKYRSYDTKINKWAFTLFDQASNLPTPLTMINVYSVFDTKENKDDLYSKDNLHLSEDGYELWQTWLTIAYDEINSSENNSCPVWNNGACCIMSYTIDCNACIGKEKCNKKCTKIERKSDKKQQQYCEENCSKSNPQPFCV